LVDRQGLVLWCTAEASAVLGSPAVQPGADLVQLLRKAQVDEGSVGAIEAHLARGTPFTLTCTIGAPGQQRSLCVTGGGPNGPDGPVLIHLEEVTKGRSDGHAPHESMADYFHAMLGSVDAVWEWDLVRSRLIGQSGMDRLLGIPASEVRPDGSHWTTRLEQATLQQLGALTQDLMAGRRNGYVLEYKVRTNERGSVWVRDRGTVLTCDKEGRPERMFGVIVDIDRIKRAEQERAIWEKRLTTLINNLGVGVVLEDEQHRVILADQTFCSFLGLDAPDLVGRTMREVLVLPQALSIVHDAAILHHDDHAGARARARVTGELVEMTNGRVFERDHTPVTLDDGGMTGHLWVYREVTDRLALKAAKRRQEERFRQLIDNMKLGRLEMDPDLYVTDANDHLCRWIGAPRAEILGRSINDLPNVGHLADMFIQRMHDSALDVPDNFEVEVTHPDGSLRYLHVSGSPRYDAKRTFLGTVAVFVDLTERRRMEEQLRIATNEAMSALRTKELFLANMGHELRTPLHAIIGLGNEVLRTLDDPDASRHLRTVVQAARDLRDLVNDIMEQARAGANTIELVIAPVAVRALVAHVRSITAPDVAAAGIALHTHVAPEVAAHHLGDARRMQQVLLNLLSNAVKFTRQGRIDLSVEARPSAQGRQVLTFTVKDTGRGISPGFMPRIFQPFDRDPALEGSGIEGNGLGLTICRQLLDHMGGTISVESRLGAGTTATVELVLDVVSDPASIYTTSQDVGAMTIPPGLRALVVDDSSTNRAVLSTLLSDLGMGVQEAANAGDALVHLCTGPFDLLFLDIQMPDMSGHDLLRVMRDLLGASLPTIMVTAGGPDTINAQLGPGFCHVLHKPFEKAELVAAIGHCWSVRGDRGLKGWDPAIRAHEHAPDLRQLGSLSGGNTMMVKRVLEAFITETPVLAEDLLVSAQAGHVERTAALVHRLKPGLLMLGQAGLVEQLERLSQDLPGAGVERRLGLATAIRWRLDGLVDAIQRTDLFMDQAGTEN
jgi:PAS domain S-box-containing protein